LHAPDQTIASGALSAWQARWDMNEGDRELNLPWPARLTGDQGEVPAEFLSTLDTPACFAATSTRGALGCRVGVLPPAPADWLPRTYERTPVVLPPLLEDASFPAIPVSADGRYGGEKIDLAKVPDLGIYLTGLLRSRKAAPHVVLHLSGRGKTATSPITVTGLKRLTLWFEPAKGKDEPLTLTVKPGSVGKEAALLQLEGGSLELLGARISYPESRTAVVPPYMVLVRDAELKLKGCVFQAPHELAPDAFKGLLRCETMRLDEEKPTPLVIQDCVLRAPRRLLELHGANVVLRCKNNLFYAGEDGLLLAPAALSQPRLCLVLENNTFATRGNALLLRTESAAEAPLKPVLIQATQNYFLDPFVEGPRQAALLSLSAEDLAHGWLLWQGRDNALEETRWGGLWNDGVKPGGQLDLADWRSWWGSPRDPAWKKVEPPATWKAFPLESPVYPRLVPPPPYRPGIGPVPFGADLLRLELVRKKG
jgi:hypothetical protein